MGRSKKIINGETTSEKILGKLPKIKSNIGSLDFDEDVIDGTSILSFKNFEDLKEYYPLEKIQPNLMQDVVPKKETKKRKIKEKPEKAAKPRKRKPVIKQQALGASSLAQFDKSESEAEEEKPLIVKTEASPAPSPLPELPPPVRISTEPAPVPVSTPVVAAPTIKSEGCATSEPSVTTAIPPVALPTPAPVPVTGVLGGNSASGSPIYQPSSQQHLPIPIPGGKLPAASGSIADRAVPGRMPTPSAPASHLPPHFAGLHRQHPVAAPSHHGLHFPFPPTPDGSQMSPAELERKLNQAKYDPRSFLLQNGRFPSPAEMSVQARMRAATEYDRYLHTLHQRGSRPLFPASGSTPRPAMPSGPPPPVNHPLIAQGRVAEMQGAAAVVAGSSAGTAIKRRLNDKKWSSIHVYIARLIYKKQQENKAKESLNGASASNGSSSSGEASSHGNHPPNHTHRPPFMAGKPEMAAREFPPFGAGFHNLPPTPASPFPQPNTPFNPSMAHAAQQQHQHSLRGLSSLHGLGNRFPAPAMRPPYSGMAAAAAAAGAHYGGGGHPMDPIRHALSNYNELSRLEQERLHQHLAASMRSNELLNRSMYESSLRHQHVRDALVRDPHAHARDVQHAREHEMQQAAMSREMLMHLEEQRRKLMESERSKMVAPPPASLANNLSELYNMHPQHLQAHLKYPGPGPSQHGLASFPNIFNRSIDPRTRFSHLIPPPKGPE